MGNGRIPFIWVATSMEGVVSETAPMNMRSVRTSVRIADWTKGFDGMDAITLTVRAQWRRWRRRWLGPLYRGQLLV